MQQTAQSVPALSYSCDSCPIRHRAVCSRCETDELKQLEAMKFYRTYDAGQTIAIRGDAMETISSVVTGTATLTRIMEDGRTQMVGLLLPSDFIGRPGRDTMQYDVTAVSEVTLCCFHRAPFEQMIYRTPHLGERLMEMALDELDAARDWMLLLGRKTAREKVASFLSLVYFRNVSTSAMPHLDSLIINLPITREVMATYLGLTIETVSRQMTALRKDNVIATEGKKKFTILDLDTLLIEAGDDAEGSVIS